MRKVLRIQNYLNKKLNPIPIGFNDPYKLPNSKKIIIPFEHSLFFQTPIMKLENLLELSNGVYCAEFLIGNSLKHSILKRFLMNLDMAIIQKLYHSSTKLFKSNNGRSIQFSKDVIREKYYPAMRYEETNNSFYLQLLITESMFSSLMEQEEYYLFVQIENIHFHKKLFLSNLRLDSFQQIVDDEESEEEEEAEVAPEPKPETEPKVEEKAEEDTPVESETAPKVEEEVAEDAPVETAPKVEEKVAEDAPVETEAKVEEKEDKAEEVVPVDSEAKVDSEGKDEEEEKVNAPEQSGVEVVLDETEIPTLQTQTAEAIDAQQDMDHSLLSPHASSDEVIDTEKHDVDKLKEEVPIEEDMVSQFMMKKELLQQRMKEIDTMTQELKHMYSKLQNTK